MQKIPITRNFDKTKTIGYMLLPDDLAVPYSSEFATGFVVVEGTSEHPVKVQIFEVSLVDILPGSQET